MPSLERIDALQPQVNAFVDVDHEGARAAAAAIEPGDERPFAGVPIAIKNNRAVTGLRLTTGAALSGDFRPQRDHNVTRRLRAAGFVIVGTTTLPEWGILPVTEGRRFGPTRNPWDLDAHARAAPRAARRRPSPPRWCRSRTATTAAARCGSPPPAAASSASSPSAGASRSRPTSASSSSSSTAS